MTPFYLGFIAGAFLGMFLGVFIICLCSIAREDKYNEMPKNER